MSETLEELRTYLTARKREVKKQQHDLNNEYEAVVRFIKEIDKVLGGSPDEGNKS